MTILHDHYHYQCDYCVPGTVWSNVHRVSFLSINNPSPPWGGTTIILILSMRKWSPARVSNWTWAETSESAFTAITLLCSIKHALSICWSFLSLILYLSSILFLQSWRRSGYLAPQKSPHVLTRMTATRSAPCPVLTAWKELQEGASAAMSFPEPSSSKVKDNQVRAWLSTHYQVL